ncbi:UNVERIFIED_CONTAM: hypothetical protein FKN15_022851 [Acipenser sinensis]
MKLLLLLLLCISCVKCESDYDEFEKDTRFSIDPRGHRPLVKGREGPIVSQPAPPPISGGSTYRARPTTPPRSAQITQKNIQIDEGGCTHLGEVMGVLCPNGCELKNSLLKQERNVKGTLASLRSEVSALSQNSDHIYQYVSSMSNVIGQRQRQTLDNSNVVGEYTTELEEQHAYLKENLDTTIPSSVRLLRGVLDNLRSKIQKLEEAITKQKAYCASPCTTSCNIPVVSGKGEYWLGNDKISQLTKMGPTELLIEMEDWNGNKVHAHYGQFTLQNEATKYTLAVGNYKGNAGNCLLEGAQQLYGENRTMTIHNGMMFSTYDRDNDRCGIGQKLIVACRPPGHPEIQASSAPEKTVVDGGITAVIHRISMVGTTGEDRILKQWPNMEQMTDLALWQRQRRSHGTPDVQAADHLDVKALDVQVRDPPDVLVQAPSDVLVRDPPDVQVLDPPDVQVRDPLDMQVLDPPDVQVRDPLDMQVLDPPGVQVRDPPDVQVRDPPGVQVQDPPDVQVPDPPDVQVLDPPDVQVRDPPDVQVRDPPDVQVRDPPDVQVRDPPDVQVRDPPDVQVRDPPDVQVRDPPDVQVRDPPDVQVRDPPDVQVRDPPDVQVRDPPDVQVRDPPAVQELDPPDVQKPDPPDVQAPDMQEPDPLDMQELDPPDVQVRDPLDVQVRDPLDVQEPDPPDVQVRDPPDVQELDPPDVKALDVQELDPPDVQKPDPPDVQVWDPLDVQVRDPPDVQEPDPLDVQVQDPLDVQAPDMQVRDPPDVQVWDPLDVQVRDPPDVQELDPPDVHVRDPPDVKAPDMQVRDPPAVWSSG